MMMMMEEQDAGERLPLEQWLAKKKRQGGFRGAAADELNRLALVTVRAMPGQALPELAREFARLWREAHTSLVDNTLLTLRCKEALDRLMIQGRVRRENGLWFANGLED